MWLFDKVNHEIEMILIRHLTLHLWCHEEVVILQNEVPDRLFIIEQGSVDVFLRPFNIKSKSKNRKRHESFNQ